MAVTPEATLTLEDLRAIRTDLIEIAMRRGASNLRVFGSVARGDAVPSSDLDVLVDLEQGRSLLDLGGLLMDLSERLGVDVDVVTETSLSPRIRVRVLSEAVEL
jgi:hypothetical protein